MNNYTPDAWILIEFKKENEDPRRKILSGWVGGYLNGDSWRLSSGVTDIKEEDNYYLISNESGSIYKCFKNCERTTVLTYSIYTNFAKACEDANVSLKIVKLGE